MENKKWTAADLMQIGIKKTIIGWEPSTTLSIGEGDEEYHPLLPTLSAGECDEEFYLFRGLDGYIDGGWLACNNAEPDGEGVLDGDEGEAIIDAVRAILDDESTPWYSIDEDDAEYLAEYFNIWLIGI